MFRKSFTATDSFFGRPFVKRFALSPYAIGPLSCLSVLSVTLLHCGQTVGWIKMKLGMQVGLGPGHTVLDGDTAPLHERGRATQFSAHICCGQTAAWIKMPLGMEVDLIPGNFVLYWDPALSSPRRGRSPPQFSANVYCGQTAGWIKMALGMEVGLSPGDFVLYGTQRRPQRGAELLSPIFGPFLFWPNGWMHQDATRSGGRSQPTGLCVRGGPSHFPKKAAEPPNFRPIFIVKLIKLLFFSACFATGLLILVK